MYAQTHAIMGAALLGRRMPSFAWAAAVGGLVPDAPMLAILAFSKFYGVSSFWVNTVVYFQPAVQIANAIAHNFWLWGVLVAIAFATRLTMSKAWTAAGSLLLAFAGSALLHSVVDFLCQREDSHMHFWPLSAWKFMSPISYWDPAHFGSYVSALETAIGLTMAAMLFAVFKNWFARIILAVISISYLAIPVYLALA